MEDKDPSAEVATEDDRTLPVINELASEAVALFSSQKYAECVDVLNQVLAKKEGDMKVLHNLAISEFFRDGCSDPRKLLEKLCKLKKRCEEFAGSSDEHVDNATPNGNNITGSKESGANPHQSSIKSKSYITYVDEFENSIITMNIAITLYHLHEYARAFSIMEPLYQNLDPYDEPTVLNVCILFLDIALAANEATKAAAVIRKLESFLGDSTGMQNSSDKGNTTHHQPQNQASQTSAVNNNAATQEISTSDSSKNSLSRTLSDDALEYENLYSTLDGSSSQTVGIPPFNRLAATANDLKLKLQLYKIRLLLISKNLKAAKREIKLSVNSVKGKDLSTELLLKAQVEYARGNYRKAVKLLTMTYSDKNEPRLLSIYNNNLGCIHYSQTAPHTSGLFFAKALKNGSAVRLEKPRKLSSFSDDKSSMICYNFGIQNLTCGKPLPAAKCFSKATLTFYDHPLLWLRLAECCFLAFEKGILGKNNAENIITVKVVGSGIWRRLIVEDLKPENSSPLKEVNSKECKVSLPFARYCLHTSLFLLSRNEQKPKLSIDSNGNSKEEKGILETSALAYEEMKREENHMIKQAVLADLAYNELLLENPLKSLSFSKMLLELPECSKIYVFLAHTYAAEALCKLNRVEEAAEHLSVYLDNEDVVLPYSDDDRVIWSLKRGTFGECEDTRNNNVDEFNGSIFMMANEAKGITYLNMVSIYVMRGETEKASQFASKALSLLPDNPKVLLASIYVDLLQGKTDEGISRLKEFNHVSYVSSNLHLGQ